MSIKRFIADSDTTITNAYDGSNTSRAVYANMGAADSLEYFSLFGRISPNSIEKSRILVKFPVSQISSSRASGSLPASGSVNFFLRLSNVAHPFSLPSDYDIVIKPVSSSWVEGTGLDMENYYDFGVSGSTGSGCNWTFRDVGTSWISGGGDYLDNYSITYHIDKGDEDILTDITNIVEKQISGEIPNYGLGIMLSGNYEESVGNISYYTKKFSARNSQFFYKKPTIEARWNSSLEDDRDRFYASSSLLESSENKYNLYFYNKFNGIFRNIPGNPNLTVKFYTDSTKTVELTPTYLSTSIPKTGIYKAVVSLDTTESAAYDYWVNQASTGTIYFSSSFDINTYAGEENDSEQEYIIKITNLRDSYSASETSRLKIFSREKNWNPTIYTVANQQVENSVHKNLYYKIFRYSDNYSIIDYSTGSLKYSLTSYDSSGNFFDIDFSIFEPDYSYAIKFSLIENNNIKEFKELFKFRVNT
jgi:hypothetical protein